MKCCLHRYVDEDESINIAVSVSSLNSSSVIFKTTVLYHLKLSKDLPADNQIRPSSNFLSSKKLAQPTWVAREEWLGLHTFSLPVFLIVSLVPAQRFFFLPQAGPHRDTDDEQLCALILWSGRRGIGKEWEEQVTLLSRGILRQIKGTYLEGLIWKLICHLCVCIPFIPFRTMGTSRSCLS